MKTRKWWGVVQAVVIFIATETGVFAATPTEKDFYDLRAQRDKAVAQAMKPINDRYQTSLEALVKRATQAGDLDTALLVRKELESTGSQSADAGTKSIDRLSDFSGTSWEWVVGKEEYSRGNLTLEKGGKVKIPGSLGFIKAWEPVSDRQFKIIHVAGSFWLFDFSPTKKEARSIFEKGALHEDRLMKLVPNRK